VAEGCSTSETVPTIFKGQAIPAEPVVIEMPQEFFCFPLVINDQSARLEFLNLRGNGELRLGVGSAIHCATFRSTVRDIEANGAQKKSPPMMHVITMARDHSQERCGEQVGGIIGFQPKKSSCGC
jgi:hypothetical protein